MKIEVFGTGCCKCTDLYDIVQSVVIKKGIDVEIVKVDDMGNILKRGVMRTPALAVDGKFVSSGRVPKPEEVEGWIR